MKAKQKVSSLIIVSIASAGLIWMWACAQKPASYRNPANFFDGYDETEEASLTESEKIGRLIWYNSTAGNSRYHTYGLPQRLVGGNPHFGKYFAATNREQRFDLYGLINDPDCCTPGSAGCPAKSLEETFGFDWCPGDEGIQDYYKKLAAYRADPVKTTKPEYRDPACDLKEPGGGVGKESPCALEFGVSTGAMGFRKFPNPRFEPSRWRGWDHYAKNSRDQSIEPPYRIGVSCGSCHISFNPAKPPKNPNKPEWANLKGTVGNQYLQNNVIFASGVERDSLEWQMFKYDRPGTSDTSAAANDQIFNPGSMNAIINLPRRPKFMERVLGWRTVDSCDESNPSVCYKDKQGRFWLRSEKTEDVFHILKGGEDSIGAAGAVQRVYINIGSCSEACWMNHHNNLRSFSPTERGFDETPFDIGQCRRDCPQYRAIEDRVGDIFNFLISAKQTDLHEALGTTSDGLEEWLEKNGYPKGSVARGREVFKQNCTQCHSSRNPATLSSVTFDEVDERGMKVDWLGSDALIPVTDVKTYGCRALHTNHKKNHVWEQYASLDYFERTKNATHAPALKGITSGGPGYYRAISLINAWAYAPFMHNNALGPEICQRTAQKDPDMVITDKKGVLACTPYPVSVEERFKVYEASMQDLLNPESRPGKITVTERDTSIPLVPGMRIIFKKGTPSHLLSSFNHKLFFRDFLVFFRSKGNPEVFKKKIGARIKDPAVLDKLASSFAQTVKHFTQARGTLEADPEILNFYLKTYTNCGIAGPEDAGHEFGKDLSPEDKKALTAFLATQ